MANLIDVVRPGVSLLDQKDFNWEYSGKLVGMTWTDRWTREDGKATKNLQEICDAYGPVAVLLQSYDGEQAWWKTESDFTNKT